MKRRRGHAWVVLLPWLATAGCGAGWRRVELPAGTEPPQRQQAQLWVGDRSARLHGLIVTTDSISGVPYFQSPSCDSCRVTMPRTAVDSVRFGDPVGAVTASVIGVVLVVLLVYAYTQCGIIYCGGT